MVTVANIVESRLGRVGFDSDRRGPRQFRVLDAERLKRRRELRPIAPTLLLQSARCLLERPRRPPAMRGQPRREACARWR